jgi:hypothetical protein
MKVIDKLDNIIAKVFKDTKLEKMFLFPSKEEKELFIKLHNQYDKEQKYLDHEGKMRGYGYWDDDGDGKDYKNFKRIEKRRDLYRKEFEEYRKLLSNKYNDKKISILYYKQIPKAKYPTW